MTAELDNVMRVEAIVQISNLGHGGLGSFMLITFWKAFGEL
jgi:hypothetical protein